MTHPLYLGLTGLALVIYCLTSTAIQVGASIPF